MSSFILRLNDRSGAFRTDDLTTCWVMVLAPWAVSRCVTSYKAAPTTRTVLSPQNANALRDDLEAVVTAPGATGHAAAVPGYRVAGKTGTGLQVKDGKYVDGEVASFIGMAPVEAPRYVIAVFAHSPGGEGGAVAAPAFRDMMAFTLRYFQVPPSVGTPPKFTLTQ